LEVRDQVLKNLEFSSISMKKIGVTQLKSLILSINSVLGKVGALMRKAWLWRFIGASKETTRGFLDAGSRLPASL
jgi:hypothetical protein